MPDHDPALDDAIRDIAALGRKPTCASGSLLPSQASLTFRRRRAVRRDLQEHVRSRLDHAAGGTRNTLPALRREDCRPLSRMRTRP